MAGKRSQAALEYIIVVGGIVVLATSSYFILRSQVQETGAGAAETEAEAFQILLDEARSITSAGGPRIKLWFDEYASKRLKVSVTNPLGSEVEQALVSIPAPPGYAGSIYVTYTDEDGNEVLVSSYVDELTSCAILEEEDRIFFTVDNLDPYASADYYVYYDDSAKCDYTSVTQDNVYLYGEDTDGDRQIVFTNITRGLVYFLGNLNVSGKGTVSGDYSEVLEPPYYLPMHGGYNKATYIRVDSDDGNDTNDMVFELDSKVAFQSESTRREDTTFFSEEKKIFFYVPVGTDSFTLEMRSHDTGVKQAKVHYPSGGVLNSGFIQGTWNPVVNVREKDAGRRWMMELPANASVVFSDIPNYFSLDMEAFFVPELRGDPGLEEPISVSYEQKPDTAPPVVTIFGHDPEEPDVNADLVVFAQVEDESNISSCILTLPSTKCGNGCLMNPSGGFWESAGSSEKVFYTLGNLPYGSHELNITCEDVWANSGSYYFNLTVIPGPDESGPTILTFLSPLVDGSLPSDQILTVDVTAQDQSGTSKCELLTQKEADAGLTPHALVLLSEEGDSSNWSYTFSETFEANVFESVQLPISISCTDTLNQSSTSVLMLKVSDKSAPTIRSVTFDCYPSSNCNQEERQAYATAELYFSVSVSDNSKLKECKARFDTDASEGILWSDWQDTQCPKCDGTSAVAIADFTHMWTEKGFYTTQVECTDVGNNPTISDFELSIVESNPPEADSSSFYPEKPRAGEEMTFTMGSVKDDTGISFCKVKITGSTEYSIILSPESPESTTYTATLSDIEPGNYFAEFDCSDLEGHNISDYPIIQDLLDQSFFVDGSPPIIDSFTFVEGNREVILEARDPYNDVVSCDAVLDRAGQKTSHGFMPENGVWTATIPLLATAEDFTLTITCTDEYDWASDPEVYEPFSITSFTLDNTSITDCDYELTPNVTLEGDADCSISLRGGTYVEGVYEEFPLEHVYPSNLMVYDPSWGEERYTSEFHNLAFLTCLDEHNFTLTDSVQFTITNTPPEIVSIDFPGADVRMGQETQVSVQVDECRILSKCEFSEDGISWQEMALQSNSLATIAHTFYTPGEKTVYARCEDSAGVSGDDQRTVSVLDAEGPLVSLPLFTNENSRIEIETEDPESGVSSVEIRAGSECTYSLSELDTDGNGNGLWFWEGPEADCGSGLPLTIDATNVDGFSSELEYVPLNLVSLNLPATIAEGKSETRITAQYANGPPLECSLVVASGTGTQLYTSPSVDLGKGTISFRIFMTSLPAGQFDVTMYCTDSRGWAATLSGSSVRENDPPTITSFEIVDSRGDASACQLAPKGCTGSDTVESQYTLFRVQASDLAGVAGCSFEFEGADNPTPEPGPRSDSFPFKSGRAYGRAYYSTCYASTGCLETDKTTAQVTCWDDSGEETTSTLDVIIEDTKSPSLLITGVAGRTGSTDHECTVEGESGYVLATISGKMTGESTSSKIDISGEIVAQGCDPFPFPVDASFSFGVSMLYNGDLRHSFLPSPDILQGPVNSITGSVSGTGSATFESAFTFDHTMPLSLVCSDLSTFTGDLDLTVSVPAGTELAGPLSGSASIVLGSPPTASVSGRISGPVEVHAETDNVEFCTFAIPYPNCGPSTLDVELNDVSARTDIEGISVSGGVLEVSLAADSKHTCPGESAAFYVSGNDPDGSGISKYTIEMEDGTTLEFSGSSYGGSTPLIVPYNKFYGSNTVQPTLKEITVRAFDGSGHATPVSFLVKINHCGDGVCQDGNGGRINFGENPGNCGDCSCTAGYRWCSSIGQCKVCCVEDQMTCIFGMCGPVGPSPGCTSPGCSSGKRCCGDYTCKRCCDNSDCACPCQVCSGGECVSACTSGQICYGGSCVTCVGTHKACPSSDEGKRSKCCNPTHTCQCDWRGCGCAGPEGGCPSVYVGDTFEGTISRAFVGVPFKGTALEPLDSVDSTLNTVSVRITEEMEEVSHIDSVSLISVEHPKGTTVSYDLENNVYVFDELLPVGCVDSLGNYCTNMLQEQDSRINDRGFIDNSSRGTDAYFSEDDDYLYFYLPEDRDEGYLVISLSATREFFNFAGIAMDKVVERMISPYFFDNKLLTDVIKRHIMDLITLRLDYWAYGRWTEIDQGHMWTAIAEDYETLVFPIDRTRVGSIIRLRVPKKMYAVDYAGYAKKTLNDYSVYETLPDNPILQEDDGEEVVIGFGEGVDMNFTLHETRQDMEQSHFLKFTGYFYLMFNKGDEIKPPTVGELMSGLKLIMDPSFSRKLFGIE